MEMLYHTVEALPRT